MNKKRIAAGIALSCLLAGLAGCQRPWPDREEFRISGKTITVMDNPEQTFYEASAFMPLIRLNDVRGMDWVSDDEILVDRENREMDPFYAEGVALYPRNLFIHSLATDVQTPLLPSSANQGSARLSPDKTKVFYQTYSMQSSTGQGHIFDRTTGESKAITQADEMLQNNGGWVDNDSVVYATLDGSVYMTDDSESKPRLLVDSLNAFPGNLSVVNGQLFFTTPKGQLIVKTPNRPSIAGDRKDRFALLPDRRIVWMAPSPNGERVAFVQKTKSGDAELIVSENFWNVRDAAAAQDEVRASVRLAIAQDSQIYGIAWSPDGSKLAYAGIMSNGTVRGIYVADIATGLSEALSVDVKFIADPLLWSPSGNRLMVSAVLPDDDQNRNRFATYLVGVDKNL
ncbi:hypothetical protein ACF3MZ_14980 [Paenibacillaceae bacterium WGS1546]|uniref:hypothetical protein n=1 Tax=Cohnella sp. WGS1546 TaxID=3366810 RepID=UPI00372D7959